MIEYIKGIISELTPTTATLETEGGVAYILNITLPTYNVLEGKKEAKLYVHESIREDAWTLFGFAEKRERAIFRELIGVSGVGSGTARIILSSIPAPELEIVIANEQESRLKNVKGIGQKTAQRIIVDLRGKIKPSEDALLDKSLPTGEAYEEALAALITLGYQRQASQKVLKKLFGENPTIKSDEAIRKSFSML